MSNVSRKNLVEIVGTVAIVVSLGFVAFELRQSNQIGRLEAMQSLADNWLSSGFEISGNKELAGLLAEVTEGAAPSDFDTSENYQVMSFLYAVDHSWQMRFNQLQLGVLEPEDYRFPSPRNQTYNSAYHREIWGSIRTDFSDEFAVFWEHRFELNR